MTAGQSKAADAKSLDVHSNPLYTEQRDRRDDPSEAGSRKPEATAKLPGDDRIPR